MNSIYLLSLLVLAKDNKKLWFVRSEDIEHERRFSADQTVTVCNRVGTVDIYLPSRRLTIFFGLTKKSGTLGTTRAGNIVIMITTRS